MNRRIARYRMYKIVAAIRFTVVLVTVLAAPLAWAESALEQYRLAAGYYETKDWQTAVDRFGQFIADHPDDEQVATATFFRGEALVQLGRYDEARKSFQQFLRLSPDHSYAAQAMFRTGECAYLRGNDQKARNDLRAFYRRFPNEELNAYVLPYLGELALALEDAADAEAMYQAALQSFPSGPLADQCRLGLGRAFELQGNHEQALRFYRFLSSQSRTSLADDGMLREGMLAYNSERYSEAEKILNQLLAKFPTSELATEAGYWLGESQSKQQRWAEAVETFRAARPSDSKHKLAPAIEFATAEALRKTNRLGEADDYYARLVTIWPNSKWGDDSLQARVQIAFDEHDYERVGQLARSFQQLFPESELLTLVRQSQGQALLARNQFAEASKAFKQVLADADGSTPAERARWNYLLARAQLGEGNYEGVLESLAKISSGELSKELIASAQAARGTALFNLERHDQSVTANRDYLQHSPTGVEAARCRAQLAVSLAKLDRFDEAKVALNELLAAHPEDALLTPTTEILAEAAYAGKQWGVAEPLFRQLTTAGNPQQARAKGISGLAWTRAMQGRTVEAADLFQRLLDQFPESKGAAEAAFMRARLLDQLNRRQEAIEAYEVVLKRFADSAFVSQSLWRSTQLLQLEGDSASAAVAASLLDQLATSYPDIPFRDVVLYQRAWLLIDKGAEKDALPVFEKIVAEYPSSSYWADSAYRLADSAFRNGDYERAKRFVDQLVESNAKGEIVGYALYLQGQIAANQSRWKDVVKPLERLLREYPQSPTRIPAEYWIAEAHYRQRNYVEAGRRLDELLKQIEGSHETWLAIVPMRRAQVFAHQRKWLEAYEVAKGIESQFPQFAQQHEVDYLIGRSLAARAKFSDARAAYQRVVDSPAARGSEMAAMSQWMIGETYFHQKQLDQAIDNYHRVYSLYGHPHWRAAALLQAGKCHEARGQASEATRLYQQILDDFPQTQFTEKAKEQLELLRQKTATASRQPAPR